MGLTELVYDHWEVGWWKDDRECWRTPPIGHVETHRGIVNTGDNSDRPGLCFTCDEDAIAAYVARLEDECRSLRREAREITDHYETLLASLAATAGEQS